MSNVAAFPVREEEPQTICAFSHRYLDSMVYGNGWRTAVNTLTLESRWKRLPPSMKDFVAQMARAKRRPTTKQLALLVGLLVNTQSQELFERMVRDGTLSDGAPADAGAVVIPLKP